MTETQYDLLVIGTGPAGEGAAMQAAKSGLKVAVAERFMRVGGGCTHWGTIPSKALRRAIYHTNITYQNPIYKKRMDIVPAYSFPALLASANQVIEEQTDLRQSFYEHNGVRLIPGHGRFVDPHTLDVEYADGAHERFTGKFMVIATGSRPWRPPGVDFNHRRVFDSDTILTMDYTPHSVTVFGAGVVGCEYASMLANMEREVSLINNRDKLLSFLDDEIIDALSYHFADKNILVRHNEEYERIEAYDDHVLLYLKSGKVVKSEVLLWAAGRSGNTSDLGLETIGVKPNARGQVAVNEHLQVKYTTKEGEQAYSHIYAAGDVIGVPSLASASYDQGRFAANHLATGTSEYRLIQDIPTGIYTTPEISSLGQTEAQLTAAKVPYEVGKSQFRYLARAQISGQQVGMLKLLFHRETLALLGIHCFGENASEIIHIGQAIMSQPPPNNTLRYFMSTTFNYPTMAEAYRVAALNGLGRIV